MIPITCFFSAILTFMYIFLSVLVVLRRRELKLALNDAQDLTMIRRIRAHGNFSEYVPLTLILMLINELNHHSSILLISMGIALTVGRTSHAFSLLYAETQHNIIYRPIGMILTFISMAILALNALI